MESLLTVANQHMRTSYRWPGAKLLRRNQELTPRGAISDGKDASRCFLIDGAEGDSALKAVKSPKGDEDS